MVNVRRANVFLTIPEDAINKYMSQGYSLVDERGNIIKESIPNDLVQLQKAYTEHTEIIKQKDSEIADLRAQLKELAEAKASASPEGKATKAEKPKKKEVDDSWDDWADAEEVEEKPKKKHK